MPQDSRIVQAGIVGILSRGIVLWYAGMAWSLAGPDTATVEAFAPHRVLAPMPVWAGVFAALAVTMVVAVLSKSDRAIRGLWTVGLAVTTTWTLPFVAGAVTDTTRWHTGVPTYLVLAVGVHLLAVWLAQFPPDRRSK